jgi:tRNA threonylcarbamoyladenosine biosynthesis protein TsaE
VSGARGEGEPAAAVLRAPLRDAAATRAAGAAVARTLAALQAPRFFLALRGDLGAGKTTFARGFLGALGVAGPVRSPTYTLVESYPAGDRTVHHLDWYRLAGDDDLDALGFRELLGAGQWVLAEWPERAPAAAADADATLALEPAADGGRELELSAWTDEGRRLLARLHAERTLG